MFVLPLGHSRGRGYIEDEQFARPEADRNLATKRMASHCLHLRFRQRKVSDLVQSREAPNLERSLRDASKLSSCVGEGCSQDGGPVRPQKILVLVGLEVQHAHGTVRSATEHLPSVKADVDAGHGGLVKGMKVEGAEVQGPDPHVSVSRSSHHEGLVGTKPRDRLSVQLMHCQDLPTLVAQLNHAAICGSHPKSDLFGCFGRKAEAVTCAAALESQCCEMHLARQTSQRDHASAEVAILDPPEADVLHATADQSQLFERREPKAGHIGPRLLGHRCQGTAVGATHVPD
mmetsp:Transcript_116003/g.275635  ORF Transcript_116003/g.275635 Transcript_116003/m.275635 type:complete len:288 (-) Transcript_116003:572-1435(-)